ncbi:hypothetical protein A5893_15860 [Pedobacter psychrophilus]|uniref:Peptidase M48 domain-containing protein n=1 Tax=Pedobacter psychrophilus TaxID=1826909 RepID=A0A179DB37_9SPHI|nr:hypothetical protein [Pedobacter psychrophilus]OAQ38265.1 hypothetical protein A5893_15860 [Pedobacter psychrophilus]
MILSQSNLSKNPSNQNLDEFRYNKKIPKIIEHNVLIALSHYPELKNTPISFVFKKDIKKSVMQAQPIIGSLLGGKDSRAYRINISSMFKLTHSVTPIHQLPDSIMIGWIGHELGHIMDYEHKSTFGMIAFGLGYFFYEKSLKKAEVAADTYAVNHGLGAYILDTKRFILDNSDLPEVYKKRIARLYLSPDDIVEQIKKLEEAKIKGAIK